MNTSDATRDTLAGLLYFVCAVKGQGDPTWDELIATYGEDSAPVTLYRQRATMLLDSDLFQVVAGAISFPRFIEQSDVRTIALANRVRAAVRLVSPDHMTPVAARQIAAVLTDGAGPDPYDALRAELYRLSDMIRDQNEIARELATALGERDDARRTVEQQGWRIAELERERDDLCLLVEDLGGTVPE